MTLYGKGVYFALNSELSTRDIYSPPDPSSQERNIFQCRVLVGHPVVGSERLNVLPTRQGHILYDSATDDMRNPSLYVIFHDSQAYPEYIITFRSTGTWERDTGHWRNVFLCQDLITTTTTPWQQQLNWYRCRMPPSCYNCELIKYLLESPCLECVDHWTNNMDYADSVD